MKLLKKLLCLGVMLTTLLGLGFLTVPASSEAGNEASSSTTTSVSTPANVTYVYRVSVQNATGFGFSNATVKLMDGDTVVAEKKTNASGNANFFEEEITAGEYTVAVENIPDGYALPDTVHKTSTSAGTTTTIVITPTGLLTGEIPNGTRYKLGSVMYDFTATLANGTKYKLSDILAEKKLVLINFWATWCGPCKSEFPAMHNAVLGYDSTVSVLAISTTDSNQAAAEFMSSNGYKKFNVATVANDTACYQLHNMVGVSSIPHSIMVDRYGVVVFNEVGSLPSTSAFTVQFDKFIGDDYLPTVVGNAQEDLPDSSEEEERIKPIFEAPSAADLKAAFAEASASSFEFRFQEDASLTPDEEAYDEYNWPWLISKDADYIYASNQLVHSSYAILYSTMTAAAGDVLTFDYMVGSETNADIFYVILDGTVIQQYSGNYTKDWLTSYAYVFTEDEVGKHDISFVFLKDSEISANDDIVQIKNLRILDVDDIKNAAGVDANIFRNAATVLNTDKNATTQYQKYVEVVLNPQDEYYHVGAVDGPVLYANMMNASLWSYTSIWLLAYNDYIIDEYGMNFHTAIEDFAWEASQITTVAGYAPVTEDLRYLLDVAVRCVEMEQKWEGDYHANEWLETCVYWEHYGDSPLPSDPLAGISFTSAIELKAGVNGSVENEINVPYALNPRGFKYKFIPETSGAYHVYSTGYSDSIAFLVDEDRETHLGYFDNKVFAELISDDNGIDIYDNNFEFYWFFEAGKTYYILFTTYLDQAATYNVHVDYLGESYVYMENAAVGPYSANLNTFELFLPDAIDYAFSEEDGYYHHVKQDGTLGGIIYLDVNRPTAFMPTSSLYDICRQAEKYDETKRALYVNGYDYTPYFKKICFYANQNVGRTHGFAAVTQELFDALDSVIRSSKYDGIDTTWLLLCYYDKTLAANE